MTEANVKFVKSFLYLVLLILDLSDSHLTCCMSVDREKQWTKQSVNYQSICCMLPELSNHLAMVGQRENMANQHKKSNLTDCQSFCLTQV